MRPVILQLTKIPMPGEQLLTDRFDVVRPPLLDEQVARRVVGIATTAHGRVDASLLDTLPALKIVSCFSAGTDGFDLEAAKSRGIVVTTTSHLIAGDVADIALGLVISLCRHFCEAIDFVRSGAWAKGVIDLGRSVSGLRLGIVGMGNIGQAVARRAQAFDMQVSYCGPRRKPQLSFSYYPSVEELAEHSDVLVVCCPETEETRQLIGARVLAKLGPSGLIINVARGSIIDEAALLAALQQGTIAGAGLDVFLNEPFASVALTMHPKVVPLPHIGAATREIRWKMAEEMVHNLLVHVD